MLYYSNNYLVHHGIKGQKWGVKNGPPYPLGDEDHSKREVNSNWRQSLSNKKGLTDKQKKYLAIAAGVAGAAILAYGAYKLYDSGAMKNIISAGKHVAEEENARIIPEGAYVMPKGYRLNSVSGDFQDSDEYLKRPAPLYTYNPDDEWDKRVYEGPFSTYLTKYRGAEYVAVHQYETVSDLIMPNKSQRIQEFKNLFDDPVDRKYVISELSDQQRMIAFYKSGSQEDRDKFKRLDLNNINSDDDWETAYKLFGHVMEDTRYKYSPRKYLENMSKKFDAMVDDNNKGSYNDAHDPIIIFNAMKVMKPVENLPVRYITDSEMHGNYEYVKNELEKMGKVFFQ